LSNQPERVGSFSISIKTLTVIHPSHKAE